MEKKSIWKNGEFYLGLFILALAALTFYMTGFIKHDSSKVWPRVILVPLTLSGAAILIASLKKEYTPLSALRFPPKVLGAIAAILVMILLEPLLGLLPSLFLFSLALNLIIQGVRSPKHFLGQLVFSAALYLICYLVFAKWLGMYLPAGSLFTK